MRVQKKPKHLHIEFIVTSPNSVGLVYFFSPHPLVSEFVKTCDGHITGLVGDKMAFLGIWTVCLRVAELTALSKIKQLL